MNFGFVWAIVENRRHVVANIVAARPITLRVQFEFDVPGEITTEFPAVCQRTAQLTMTLGTVLQWLSCPDDASKPGVLPVRSSTQGPVTASAFTALELATALCGAPQGVREGGRVPKDGRRHIVAAAAAPVRLRVFLQRRHYSSSLLIKIIV